MYIYEAYQRLSRYGTDNVMKKNRIFPTFCFLINVANWKILKVLVEGIKLIMY